MMSMRRSSRWAAGFPVKFWDCTWREMDKSFDSTILRDARLASSKPWDERTIVAEQRRIGRAAASNRPSSVPSRLSVRPRPVKRLIREAQAENERMRRELEALRHRLGSGQ